MQLYCITNYTMKGEAVGSAFVFGPGDPPLNKGGQLSILGTVNSFMGQTIDYPKTVSLAYSVASQ